MQHEVFIDFLNTSYIKILSDDHGILESISTFFSFYAEGYKFQPKYKAGMWDGRIKLFDLRNKTLPYGLLANLVKYLQANEIDYKISDSLVNITREDVSSDDIVAFCDDVLKLPFEPYDYQVESVLNIIKSGRRIVESPTGSGKSLIQYIAARWLLDVEGFKRILITVPTINLVSQLKSDFKDYAVDDEDYYEESVIKYEGKRVATNEWKASKVVISTWQSVYKKDEEFFNGNFDVLFSDECHTMSGIAASSIVSKSTDVMVKIGFTGTVANNVSNEMVLTGLFGPKYKTTTTEQLINSGINSDVVIKCIKLQHAGTIEKATKLKYAEEMTYLLNSQPRNEFIVKVAERMKGNTLILFQQHAQADMLEQILSNTQKKVYRVDGKVKAADRESARQSVEETNIEEEDGVIILASYPTFQAGVNIKNLHNIIFASPTKSMIRILQSIGRVLRKHHTKDRAVVVDIFDDFGFKSKRKNHTLMHFLERYSIYKKGKFDTTVGNGVTITI